MLSADQSHSCQCSAQEENGGLAAKMEQLCLELKEPCARKAFWPCLLSQAGRSSRRHLVSHVLLEAWAQRQSLEIHLRNEVK